MILRFLCWIGIHRYLIYFNDVKSNNNVIIGRQILYCMSCKENKLINHLTTIEEQSRENPSSI